MAISLKTAGSWARVVTDPSSVTIPGSPAAGDRMFLFASWKDYAITVANPSGWTPIVNSFADGTTGQGNGTGSVSVAAWYRDWQSGDGNPSLDWSAAPNEAHAVVMLWQKAGGDTWGTPDYRTGAIAAASPFTVNASATVVVQDAAVVMGLVALRDDSTTLTRASDALDDTDGLVTWNGNYVESPATHYNSTTGNDASGDLGHRLVTTGAAGVTLHMDGTPVGSETGSALFVLQALLVAITGTGAGTGAASTASGTGTETFSATGAGAGVVATSSGTGTETFSATGAGTGTASTTSGDGTETFIGTGAGTGTGATGDGVGEISGGDITGTGDGVQVAASATGDATETFTGTGVGGSAASSGDGTGTETFVASGAGVGAAATSTGTGAETFSGTGAGIQVPASGAGSDLQPVTGTGAGTGASPSASGVGTVGAEAPPVQGGLTIYDNIRPDFSRKVYGRGKGTGALPSGRGKGHVSTDELDFAALLEQIGDAA